MYAVFQSKHKTCTVEDASGINEKVSEFFKMKDLQKEEDMLDEMMACEKEVFYNHHGQEQEHCRQRDTKKWVDHSVKKNRRKMAKKSKKKNRRK